MATDSTDNRPLAPASWPVLAGVVALTLLISFGISERAGNDYLAVISFVATLLLATILLDKDGRKQARLHPHRLYNAKRLPSEKSLLRTAAIVGTLLLLIAYVTLTATAATFGSPMPYFVAIAFLYLVLPQLLARRVVARDDRLRQAKQ